MKRPEAAPSRSRSLARDGRRSRVPAGANFPRYGVVDLGSNSVRLVIYAGLESVPATLFNEKVLCALGRDLRKTGRLSPKGAELALTSIGRFAELARTLKVERLDLLATAAIRDAEDGPDFVAEIERLCGQQVTVLSGAQEARLAAKGVIWGAPKASGIVGDLGGGSLELVRVDRGKILKVATLPLGTLRLSRSEGKDGKDVRRVIDQALDRLDWLGLVGQDSFYAVGGAWRALARVQMEFDRHPLYIIHGFKQPTRRVRNSARLLSEQTPSSLGKIGSVLVKRLETLPLAGLVLHRVLGRVRPAQVVFSSYGLREGWLYQHLPKAVRKADPLFGAAREAAARDPRLEPRGDQLVAWTQPLCAGESEQEHRLRRVVCELCDIAWRELPDYRAAASLEQILRWPYLPADHGERAAIGLALYWRYGGGPEPAITHPLLGPEQRDKAQLLGLALRLADSVSGGTSMGLKTCQLEVEDDRIFLTPSADSGMVDGDLIQRRLAQLQKFYQRSESLLSS